MIKKVITPREIERKTMSPEKRKSAKKDYFAFYIGRPLSYVLTVPLLYTNITPNAVSLCSIVFLAAGFFIVAVGTAKEILCLGWGFFFIWNLLDGVDGNIARYKEQFTELGSVYDAMSGYAAMVLSYFAWGIAAAHHPGILSGVFTAFEEGYIIIGAFSGIFAIFPRFIMHKAINTINNRESLNRVNDKSEYGTAKLIALNLTSISGFVQLFMLAAVLLDMLDLFTLCYFMLNLFVMIISLISIFRYREDK